MRTGHGSAAQAVCSPRGDACRRDDEHALVQVRLRAGLRDQNGHHVDALLDPDDLYVGPAAEGERVRMFLPDLCIYGANDIPRSLLFCNFHQDFSDLCADGANDIPRSLLLRNFHQDFSDLCADGANDIPRSLLLRNFHQDFLGLPPQAL